MTTEHTPTPWTMHSGAIWKAGPDVWPVGNLDGIPIAKMDRDTPDTTPTERDANAAFIVRAVNSFDAMKEACESTLAYIENHFGMTPEGQAQRNAARDQLRAALALAERGEK